MNGKVTPNHKDQLCKQVLQVDLYICVFLPISVTNRRRTLFCAVIPGKVCVCKDIEGVISMAARRIRREGARGNMGEYGNVWDGMGEDTVVDGATAKENLAVGADGNTGSTGNTATGAAGLRFALDEDGGYFPAPDEWGTAYTSMSGKGLQAIEFLLKKQDGFVPAAFNRSDLGDIDIVYGRTGEGIDDDGGYGLAHIMKRHPDINWNKIVDVISNGSIRSGGKKKKIIISDDGKIILRVKQKGRNWVISAFSNTSAEEILSASAKNGSDANIYRRGIYTIGDVFDNVKPDGEKNLKKDNFRFSVSPVYTGSAADYDKPSLQFIGTGEGAQVYGWGLYGSESRKVAEWYAEQDIGRKPFVLSIDGVKKERDEFGQFESVLIDDLERLQIDEDIVFNFTGATSKDYIDWAIEYNESHMEHYGEIKHLTPAVKSLFEFLQRYVKWLKENRDKIRIVPERNLYKQTFWPGKSENLLDWNKSVPAEQLDLIAEALKIAEDNTDLNGIERTDTDKKGGFEYERKKFLTNLGFNKAAGISGGQLYEQMIYIFGSPKAASEFLYRAGIDGITYIGDSSGVRNYVAFSDEDIRIDEHYRFLLAEFSEADRRDITLILKPFVGFALDHEDRIYKDYLAKKGIAVSEKDAHAFAVFAMRENNSDRNKRTAQRREKARLEYNRKRDQYLYDNFPFYREAVEFAGSHDFKIKPSGKFRGEEFSGYSSLAIFTFFSILKLTQAMKSAARPIMYGRSFFRKSVAV